MSRAKKNLTYFLSPLIFLLLLAVGWQFWLKPLALSFINSQIPQINSDQSVVSLSVDEIDISLLRLQLIASGLRIELRDQNLGIKPVRIKRLEAQLDIFNLIIGQLNVARLKMDGTEIEASLDLSQKSTEPVLIPIDAIFQWTELIPVDRFVLENNRVLLTFQDLKSNPKSTESSAQYPLQNPIQNSQLQMTIPLLTLQNRRSFLLLNLTPSQLEFQNAQNTTPVSAQLELSAQLNPKLLSLSKLRFTSQDTDISAQAQLADVKNLLESPRGELDYRARANLEGLRTIALTLFPQKSRTPSVTGQIESSGSLRLQGWPQLTGQFSLKTTPVVIDHYELGETELSAEITEEHLNLKRVAVKHPSGLFLLRQVFVEKKSPHKFSLALETEKFDLQKMFVSLNQGNIPAGFIAQAKTECGGQLLQEPTASCRVTLFLTDIWVKAEVNIPNDIIRINGAGLVGQAQITPQQINFNSQIKFPDSNGSAQGVVKFSEGFDIEFDSPQLNLADVKNLANMQLTGLMQLKGRTSGNSSKGIIDAQIKIKNAEVENFRLGDLSAQLNYRDSALLFEGLQIKVNQSEMHGKLAFDFNSSSLNGELSSETIFAQDLHHILHKKFNLPITFSGQGQAQARFSGPFDFWKMSYSIQSQFKAGLVQNEKYDELFLHLNADGKKIQFEQAELRKTKSRLRVTGHIDTERTEPAFNLSIFANPFMLEESDHILRYAPSISGTGYAEGLVQGPLSAPEASANLTLKQVNYDKIEYPNSQAEIRLNSQSLVFKGQLFGRQIQSDVVWPWQESGPMSMHILIHDLNPLFLLPLISIPQPSSDFSSLLNAEINLKSRTRKFTDAEGFIKLSSFFLRRGVHFLKLTEPSDLIFKSGLTQMTPIQLKGDDSFINVKLGQNTATQLRFDIATDLQLRLFHFLVPFTQSLSGNLILDTQVMLRNNRVELFGEGELLDGFVAMKGFPLPIEDINTPIEFSKSKIFLNDITGQLGQSDVTGLGQVEIVGSKNVSVNLRAVADSIELNFPDKIRTAGRANLLFSGSWLPYKLKADYVVANGLVEKDFGQSEDEGLTLKASPYLPAQQIEQLAPSLLLDVNIDLSRGVLVKNQLLEGEAFGQLQVSGSPESPLIKGRVDMRPSSKLMFRDKAFDIQTASVQFLDSKEINPDIYMSANARVSEYDINLLVQGSAKNLAIKPTSQPPLAENDIFSLLALGVTSQGDQNLTSDTQQKQTGLEVLAAISNQSQINKRIQEKLGLTLQLAPAVDSTKNIAVPKVVVSKKISDNLNASYSKPFTGNDQNQEVKLQYLYNNHVSLLLNYQNKDTGEQQQLNNSTNNSKGILGLDLEYRDDFK